jgi:hypothetical protein
MFSCATGIGSRTCTLVREDVRARLRNDRVTRKRVGLCEHPRPLRGVADVGQRPHSARVHTRNEEVPGIRCPANLGVSRCQVQRDELLRRRIVQAIRPPLHTVGGELRAVTTVPWSHVHVVSMHERLPLPVGRKDERHLARNRVGGDTGVRHNVARDALATGAKLDAMLVVLIQRELEGAEWQLVRVVGGIRCESDGSGQSSVVEEGPCRTSRRIDDEKVSAVPRRVAEPEPVSVPVPSWRYAIAEHQARRAPGQELLGARVPLHDGAPGREPVGRGRMGPSALGTERTSTGSAECSEDSKTTRGATHSGERKE